MPNCGATARAHDARLCQCGRASRLCIRVNNRQITTSPAMFPPKRYPIRMHLGSRFGMGDFAEHKWSEPQRLLSHKYQGGG